MIQLHYAFCTTVYALTFLFGCFDFGITAGFIMSLLSCSSIGCVGVCELAREGSQCKGIDCEGCCSATGLVCAFWPSVRRFLPMKFAMHCLQTGYKTVDSGSLDKQCTLERGKHLRLCNWVLFLKMLLSEQGIPLK